MLCIFLKKTEIKKSWLWNLYLLSDSFLLIYIDKYIIFWAKKTNFYKNKEI